MFIDTSGKGAWSAFALKGLLGSIVATLVFSLAHAVLQGMLYSHDNHEVMAALLTFVSDLRYLTEQLIYVAAILFVGAKFFETRTTFAVTFDRVDAGKISLRGPDEDNIVWIGHRYGSRAEAEAVAAAFEVRLKENAA